MDSKNARRNKNVLGCFYTSIIAKVLRYVPPSEDEGPVIENFGMRLAEEEVDKLVDLLEKMLKYNPEERDSYRGCHSASMVHVVKLQP
jgi:hypothetical protein